MPIVIRYLTSPRSTINEHCKGPGDLSLFFPYDTTNNEDEKNAFICTHMFKHTCITEIQKVLKIVALLLDLFT